MIQRTGRSRSAAASAASSPSTACVGKRVRDERAKGLFSREIGRRDEVDSALLLDVEAAAEVLPVDPAGRQRGFDGGGEIERVEGQSGELLAHAHGHAAFRPPGDRHVVHEVAHEEDAAAARLEHVLGVERIGDLRRIESLALVEHLDDELLGP